MDFSGLLIGMVIAGLVVSVLCMWAERLDARRNPYGMYAGAVAQTIVEQQRWRNFGPGVLDCDVSTASFAELGVILKDCHNCICTAALPSGWGNIMRAFELQDRVQVELSKRIAQAEVRL